ncbi:MAG: lysophospholipid acyltransferase family protein [Planctomycetota bacterium]
MLLRNARRWWTAKGSHAALRIAPALPASAISMVEWFVGRLGPRLPVLAKVVADNMRSADLYSPDVLRAYFNQVALHLSNAVRVFRIGRIEGEVGRLARSQVDVDDSISHVHHALSSGRGAVIVPPHVCNYLLTLVRLNQEAPVDVYLRWSKDGRRQDLKRAWCESAGLSVILEPASEADPTSRAARCVEALQRGAALVMTPDIAQKADKGVAVDLLGRRAYLPTGPASIAMLAGAPLVPVFGRLERDTHVITARPPIEVESLSRSQGGRKASIQRAMQAWVQSFEAFLRKNPQAWFLWGDSRWTRVFRGDPEYAAALSQADDGGVDSQ